MRQTLTYPGSPRRGGLVVGIAASILLHALLLALWRTPAAPPVPPDERRWAQPLTVRIVQPPSPPPESFVLDDAPAKPDKPAARPVRPRAAPGHAKVEAGARADKAEPPAIAVVPATPAEPSTAPADGAPKFDADAARAAARAMANDLDAPPRNWAAEKLRKAREREETENERLGRNIAGAARPDCKTAYAGAGLLAPLLMLMDKKDSGCKW
jgi:hypothetical protein